MNARPEEVQLLPGWGDKKVQRWCQAVREPFRSKKAAKRGLSSEQTPGESRDLSNPDVESVTPMIQANANVPERGDTTDAGQRLSTRPAEDVAVVEPVEHEGESLRDSTGEKPKMQSIVTPTSGSVDSSAPSRKRPASPDMSDGVMAALTKLRQNG